MAYVYLALSLMLILAAHLYVHKLPTGSWSFLLSFFYRDIHSNSSFPVDNTATIVVANHPNAFIDPFAAQVALNRSLVRTVRADWLHHWLVKWFIRCIGAVPLARFKQDKHSLNRGSFKLLHDELSRGKWVIIFPEGISHNRSKLKKFKRGAAHIAAEYMAQTGKPVRILQLAIYYTDKSRLNSDIWIEKAGETVYQPGTAKLDIAKETEQWQRNIQSALPGKLRTREKQKLNSVNSYLDIMTNNHSHLIADPQFWHKDTQIAQLHTWLQMSGLDLKVLTQQKTAMTLILILIAEMIVLISGLPVAMLGLIVNIPLALVHYLVTRQQSRAEDKWASNAYVIGLPLYPLFWISIAILFNPLAGLIACISGIYGLLYWTNWAKRKKNLFTAFNCLAQPGAQQSVQQLAREALLPIFKFKHIKT